MARKTGTICPILTAALIIFFLTFSGCSDSINSPLSLDDTAGVPELSGANTSSHYTGEYPSDEWESARDSRVLRTREGELISAADIVLEYDPDDFPPGLEPWVHLSDPRVYQFTIMPPGIVKDRPIRVTVNYSRADLEGVTEEDIQAYGADSGVLQVVNTDVDPATNRAAFNTTDFARYALARD